MFELEVIDNRDENELRMQEEEFKKDLIEFIEGVPSSDDIEKETIEYIQKNKIHYSNDVKYHKDNIKRRTENSRCFEDGWIYEKYMKEYSETRPHLVFKLIYKPDDPYKAWVKYYKDGKMQHSEAKFVIDDFNEDLLK
tara:strand:+ start:868 stop:1281 length:414 start_codon:yes stop_codon:yes gene_type:complete